MLVSSSRTLITQTRHFCVWVIIFFSLGCGQIKTCSSQKTISAIRVTSSLPGVDSQGQMIRHEDTLAVFYYKDLVMYQISILNTYSNTVLNKSGDVESETLTGVKLVYKYFVFKKGDPFGIIFDSIDSKWGKRISVDSFLMSNTVTSFDKFYRRKRLNDSLIGIADERGGDIVVEKYIPKMKLDISKSDSTLLYLNRRLKGIGFSFSNEVDSVRKSKLVQVRIIFSTQLDKVDPYLRQRREILFKLEEVKVKNSEAILKLFKRV